MQNEERQAALVQIVASCIQLGFTVNLVVINDDGEAMISKAFGPSAKTREIHQFAAAHPSAVPTLPLAANQLLAVRVSGDDVDGALYAISHGDIPPTAVINDTDGSQTLVYQIPHGQNPTGLIEGQLQVAEYDAVVEFLFDESEIMLPPGGWGDDTCAYADPDAHLGRIADAPAWVIANTDRGPLKLAGTAVERPVYGATVAELERIGFWSSKGEVMDRFNANTFAGFLASRMQIMRSVVDDYFIYNGMVWCKVEEVLMQVFIRDLLQAYNPGFWTPALNARIRETLKVAVPTFDPSEEPRWGLTLRNGVLNLETLVLQAHHYRHRCTVQVPIDYDPTADCPRFRQFLAEIFEGDEMRAATLQEYLGYCLTAETRAEKALALVGPGANGKSVVLRVMRALCGPMNASSLSLANLQGRFNSFALVGKLVNFSAENELRGTLNTELFKLIVSGEPIEVEKKFKQSFTFTPYCKLVLAMNSLPRTDDPTSGFSRRLLVIPCRRIFAATEQDKHLSDTLLAELPGILNFALAGLQRLRANDFVFTESPVSTEMWQEYRLMLCPFLAFTEACLDFTATARTSRQDLKAAFARWCRHNGHAALAGEEPRRFLMGLRDALVERGIPFSEVTSNGVRFFTNVALKDDQTAVGGAFDEPEA